MVHGPAPMSMFQLSLALLCVFLQTTWCQTCSSPFGHEGTTECVVSPDYTGKQWATCLSEDYIQEKSGGNHFCQSPGIMYCWYEVLRFLNFEISKTLPFLPSFKSARPVKRAFATPGPLCGLGFVMSMCSRFITSFLEPCPLNFCLLWHSLLYFYRRNRSASLNNPYR